MMDYYIALLFFTTVISSCQEIPNSEKTVLVFGGTGSIGSHVVLDLLEHGYKPTLVSRGNWQANFGGLIRSRVTHLYCDRYFNRHGTLNANLLRRCLRFMDYLKRHKYIDYVIDFSAFNPAAVKQAAEVLGNKVGLYVYISSDIVYEVCRKPKKVPIKETECVRPEDAEERRRLAQKYSYADQKLQVEEFLKKQRSANGFPYLILRLADVIGPHDNSKRWAKLQMWVKYYRHLKQPFYIDDDVDPVKSSLVYIKDVPRVVLSAMNAGHIVNDQIYNVAFNVSFSYRDIIKSIAKELKAKGIKVIRKSNNQIYSLMTKGPLDVTKLEQHLDFQHTSWIQAVHETIAWFEESLEEESERQPIVEFLSNNHKFDSAEFLDIITNKYYKKLFV